MVDAIERLMNPRSIAIIGASPDPAKLTGRPLAYLKKHGYAHHVYPVNPRYQTIGDYRCYPDIASLPAAPDVALVLLGSDRVVEAVSQLSERGTGAAIVLAGGFGESGPEGQVRQALLKKAAGAMRLLGPNTIGLVNITNGIMISASAALELDGVVAGRIGLISQSGGILGSILSRAVGRGVGFSRMIATGNESDLDVSDFIDYFVDDDATNVIALYLEGLRRPERFRQAALRAATAKKPIVAYKIGRSESGIRSAISHTGALAGSDRAYDALFKQLGIIRAERFSDLIDIPQTLASGRRLDGRRVAIVTSTGGAASLVADAIGISGFETPTPDEETANSLAGLKIEDAVLDRNPIDVTLAGVKPDLMQQVIETVVASPTYDAVVVVIGSSSLHQPDLVTKLLLTAAQNTTKPILAYVSPEAPQIVRHLNLSGIPAFPAPESCAAALGALLHVNAWRPAPAVSPKRTATYSRRDDLPQGALNEAESKQLFARYGIQPTTDFFASTPAEAEKVARVMNGPIVVKVLSRDVLHKTEIGGVAVNVAVEAVGDRCEEMKRRFAESSRGTLEGFLIEEMVSGGVEIILGYSHDEQLGAGVMVGLGGVATEIFKDIAMRPVPVSPRDAREMIDELNSSVLLKGFRGRPQSDIEALADAICRFSDMIEDLGEEIVEAEINPLFVLATGLGVKAADGVVVIRNSEKRSQN